MGLRASPRTPGGHPVAAAEWVDDHVLDWLAAVPHGPLRPALKAVAHAVDMLVPWTAISLRWVTDGSPNLRRATLRGWLAIGLAGILENGLLKPVVHRGRPDPSRLPAAQQRASQPSTSAFPSGHAGAATAFAVAAGRDAAEWRTSLGVTAALATYSLVYTGRHYPSDALAGVLLGAAAGVAVTRPRRSSR